METFAKVQLTELQLLRQIVLCGTAIACENLISYISSELLLVGGWRGTLKLLLENNQDKLCSRKKVI